MKKILLVDDDEQLLGAMQNILQGAGYSVAVAGDGKMAQGLFILERFDAVVSDIQMPKSGGFELAHFVKKQGNTPVILATSFREYIDSIDSYKVPIDGLLAKPFKREELLKIVAGVLDGEPSGPAAEPADLDDDFAKISIDEFVTGKKIYYDIFIRVSQSKYLKIAHGGENIEVQRIKAYKSKNLKYLYLKREDFRKYVGFTLELTHALQKSDVSRDRRRQFMKHTGEIILEQLHLEGVDEEAYDDAKTFLESAVSLLVQDQNAIGLFEALNTHADFLYGHSLAVSFIGVLLAKQLGWTSAANRLKVSMAGLFHDIGKKEIPKEILSKSRRDMSAEEAKTYENHSSLGVQLLKDVESIPSDILQIIMQHHENCVGTGFPRHIRASQINPISKVIAVADEFAKITVTYPGSKKLPTAEALQAIGDIYSGILDPNLIALLPKLFPGVKR